VESTAFHLETHVTRALAPLIERTNVTNVHTRVVPVQLPTILVVNVLQIDRLEHVRRRTSGREPTPAGQRERGIVGQLVFGKDNRLDDLGEDQL
jgi:hypothetical protein